VSPQEPTESRRLRNKLELALPSLISHTQRLCEHPAVSALYPEYLFMAHCISRASVPLLETARDRSRSLRGDPVATIVAGYAEQHIDEERGHDDLLLEDLASIGVDPSTVLTRPPSPTVAALVGSQYYWIHHYHPVALLSFILLLEGYPPSVDDIEWLQSRTGYGPEAFRTLLLHADLDPHHGAELDAVLDSLPLRREQQTVLGLSALASVQQFTAAIDQLPAGPPDVLAVRSGSTAR
jgi:pyrroloquinoline quinone (PQQ) biosynthesis protein C